MGVLAGPRRRGRGFPKSPQQSGLMGLGGESSLSLLFVEQGKYLGCMHLGCCKSSHRKAAKLCS